MKYEKKINKEKNKENEVEKKSIAQVAYRSKSSSIKQDDSETSDGKCLDDEEMWIFV